MAIILTQLNVANTFVIIALRAMREAAFTWGDTHEYYLSAAVHFADDFYGWTGT